MGDLIRSIVSLLNGTNKVVIKSLNGKTVIYVESNRRAQS